MADYPEPEMIGTNFDDLKDEFSDIYCSSRDLFIEPSLPRRKWDYHDEHISNLRRQGHLRKPKPYDWER